MKSAAFVAALAVSVALASSLLSQSTLDNGADQRAEFTGKTIDEVARLAAAEQKRAALENYAEAKTLGEALAIYKGRLVRDGKEEFVPLLSERRVRDAIITALESYDALNGRRLSPELRTTYEEIAEGVWPEIASFSGFYGLTDKRGIRYDGVGVRLRVRKPGQESPGFALPVLDAYYGQFVGPSR